MAALPLSHADNRAGTTKPTNWPRRRYLPPSPLTGASAPRPDERRGVLVDGGVEVERPHVAPAQLALVKKRQQHRRHQRYRWSARIDIAHLAGLDVRPQTRLDRREGRFER